MQQITLICNKPNAKIPINIASHIQGWIMSQISDDFAESLHNRQVTPYSIASEIIKDTLIIRISLLDTETQEIIAPLLLENQLTMIPLKSLGFEGLTIFEKRVNYLTQKEMADTFYRSGQVSQHFRLQIISPSAFKSQGQYIFTPDLRLMFQSLMRNYNYFFEGTERIDKEMLDELLDKVYISNYQLASHYYPIHHRRIPAFKGNLTLISKGVDTLNQYLSILLQVGEYTGIGIKTSMGMGSIRLERKTYESRKN